MTATLLTVHVRVNDAASGRPTPVRIRFTDAACAYYAPFGRLTKFPTGRGEDVGGNVLWEGKEYAYIDGTCEIQLPPGPLVVEIHKGPEYEALRHEVQLGQGQITLRFSIARRFDLRAEGSDTMLSFAHRGFKEANEGYALVNTGWAYYLVSLQQYLQTGRGAPHPDIDFARVIR